MTLNQGQVSRFLKKHIQGEISMSNNIHIHGNKLLKCLLCKGR